MSSEIELQESSTIKVEATAISTEALHSASAAGVDHEDESKTRACCQVNVDGAKDAGAGNSPLLARNLQQVSLIVWALPRLMVVALAPITFLWLMGPENGIGSNSTNIFGLHAMLMFFFVFVFMQESLLSYSAPLLLLKRIHLRYVHMVMHVLGFICALGGLIAIVYYKQMQGAPAVYPFFTMYSPHSWVAICFLTVWLFQLAAGIYTYVNPSMTLRQRKVAMAYHRFFGNAVYVLGAATCAMGFQDMQATDLCPIPGAGSGTGSSTGMSMVVNFDGMDMNSTMMNSTMNSTMDSMSSLVEAYGPYSEWARYASSAAILCASAAFTTLLTQLRP